MTRQARPPVLDGRDDTTPVPSPTRKSSLEDRSVVDRPGPADRPAPRAHAIPVDRIDPDPNQPRTVFDADALDRLARSLATHGQIQPIAVRPGPVPGRFTIVAGERRWRAATRAGRATLDAVILDGAMPDDERFALQIIENAQREDLAPLDQARAFRALMNYNGWSARQLAAALHLHPGTVTRSLARLNLPEPVRAHLATGQLAPSIADQITRLDDPAAQVALADRAVAEGLSRRDTAHAVQQARTAPPPTPNTAPIPDPRRHRVFPTSGGTVTVALNWPGGRAGIADALIETVQAFEAEFAARLSGPMPSHPNAVGGL